MRKWMRVAAWILAAALLVSGALAAQAGTGVKGEIEIRLDPAGCTATSGGVKIDGNSIGVYAAGVYRVRGALDGGQIAVKVAKDAQVTLILDGVELSNSDGAAIFVENAGLTTLELAEGSVNRIRSGEPVEIAADSASEDAEGGAIYAKDDLDVTGEGALEVLGYLNNGIHCSNRLRIFGGDIRVEAVNNGVKGKDGVIVSGGNLNIRSGGDGVDSDADDGEGYGTIEFAGGAVSIVSDGDGAQAATALTVSGGALTVTSGGGSAAAQPQQAESFGVWDRGEGWDRDEEEDAPSAKGLKAGTLLAISGGELSIDAADDALHSDGALEISGGALAIATGDDGAHADDALNISGGAVDVSASYEGIEANQIWISGGDIDVTASDDGLNASGGANQFGQGFDMRGSFGGFRGRGGMDRMDGMGTRKWGGEQEETQAAQSAFGNPEAANDGDGVDNPAPFNGATVKGGADTSDNVKATDGRDNSDSTKTTNGEDSSDGAEATGDVDERAGAGAPDAPGEWDAGNVPPDIQGNGFGFDEQEAGENVPPTPPEGAIPDAAGVAGMGEEPPSTAPQDGTNQPALAMPDGENPSLPATEESVGASMPAMPGEAGAQAQGMPGAAEEDEEQPQPSLRITGGRLHVNAEGDGLDSNGDLLIEGGEITVDGPSRSGNGALDSGSESGGTCRVNGGTVLAVGASGMAEGFDGDSAQPSFRYDFGETLPAGSEIAILDASGSALATHTAEKSFSSVVFSCPELALGETYTLVTGEQRVEIALNAASVESGSRSRWGW